MRARCLLLLLLLRVTAGATAQDLGVYGNGLDNAFVDFSYGGGSDLANATPFHDGAPSIAFTGNASFNAVSLAHPSGSFQRSSYSGLRLFVHGGASGGQKLALLLQTNSNTMSTPVLAASVDLTPYIAGNAIVAGAWRQVDVPLSALAFTNDGSFDRIDLQTGSPGGVQPTMYIDDVSLVAAGTPLFRDSFEDVVAPAPGQLQFASAAVSIGEGGGSATIAVQRVGGSSGAVSVDFATSNGTAQAGLDYQAASGTLNWADGDASSKSVAVTILQDALVEGTETVQLAIITPGGGATLGAPAAATLSIVDDDAPPSCLLGIENDVTYDGMLSERYSWCDAAGKARKAVLAHNDQNGPGGTRGGELRRVEYETAAGTRVVRASGSFAAGFGYVVSHANSENFCTGGGDSSSLGHFTPGTWSRVFSGRHHAILRFTQNYPRYCTTGVPAQQFNVPVTIDWLIATGRDHPLWSLTWDLYGPGMNPIVPMNRIEDDSRAPYGELLFDGAATEGAHSVVAGVGWGDRYKFASTSDPVTYNSAWTWNTPNTIPYVKLWTTAVDATMGTVQTRTILQQDAGGYFGTGRWNTTSAAGNACAAGGEGPGTSSHRMPCSYNWPYQSINYSFGQAIGGSNADVTNNTRLAWGTNFGFLGQTSYPEQGMAASRSGWPRESYATYVVLGQHTLDPVGAVVSEMESVQATTLSETIGTVRTSGVGGPGRSDTVGYAPAGWNHVYGVWAVDASTVPATAGRIDVNFNVATGSLAHPIVVISGWTSAALPTTVRYNNVVLQQDVDYFPSVRAGSQELWITLNRNLSGATNRVEVFP